MLLEGDHHLDIIDNSIYARRRIAAIAALNCASLITPPSDFMTNAYRAFGVENQRIQTIRLGLSHLDQIHRAAVASPYYNAPAWSPSTDRPLRLAYFGTTRPNKGLEVLVRAIERMDSSIRARCRFIIRAFGEAGPWRRRLANMPEVAFLGPYQPHDLIGAGDDYDIGILPHIWFENSPLVLLEHLHSGRPVIATNLGGPPEWITEPIGSEPCNGLLFPAGDAEALAAHVEKITNGSVQLPTREQTHKLTPLLRDYPSFVAEAANQYAQYTSTH